jgi:NADPH:quinone reductase-like Zn-dependent oxidoreductase
MKAAVSPRYGPPEILTVAEVPKPVPGDREVLVRIHASSVCYGDCIVRNGGFPLARAMSGWLKPKVQILGVDLSGTVESVGRAVMKFAPGDQVFGSRGDKFGAHAEYACVAEDGFLALKPANMSLEEAATVFVGACCSLYFLRKATIQPGEKVLIHGASGSLGIFAVQLAKHFGAHVTGVCGPANLDLAKSLGADEVIDYTRQDFTQQDGCYDVICDVLAKAGFPRSLRALKRGGRYLHIGMPLGVVRIGAVLLRGLWAHVTGRARFLVGPAAPVQKDLDYLKNLIEAGKLRTVIGRSYPLTEIAEAHRYAESGHMVGNVAIRVSQAPGTSLS